MAESGNKCVECGRLLRLFSGLTVNGAMYHNTCWITRSKPVPQARPVSPMKLRDLTTGAPKKRGRERADHKLADLRGPFARLPCLYPHPGAVGEMAPQGRSEIGPAHPADGSLP